MVGEVLRVLGGEIRWQWPDEKCLENHWKVSIIKRSTRALADQEVNLGWGLGWVFDTINLKHKLEFVEEIASFQLA